MLLGSVLWQGGNRSICAPLCCLQPSQRGNEQRLQLKQSLSTFGYKVRQAIYYCQCMPTQSAPRYHHRSGAGMACRHAILDCTDQHCTPCDVIMRCYDEM